MGEAISHGVEVLLLAFGGAIAEVEEAVEVDLVVAVEAEFFVGPLAVEFNPAFEEVVAREGFVFGDGEFAADAVDELLGEVADGEVGVVFVEDFVGLFHFFAQMEEEVAGDDAGDGVPDGGAGGEGLRDEGHGWRQFTGGLGGCQRNLEGRVSHRGLKRGEAGGSQQRSCGDMRVPRRARAMELGTRGRSQGQAGRLTLPDTATYCRPSIFWR